MHHLVFYLPIVFGAILAVGAAVGLLDVGPDVDLDLDLDLDLDAEVDVDAEVDLDAEADAEGDMDGGPSLSASILTLFGVGRAPLGVLIMSACFLFGVLGLAVDSTLIALGAHAPSWILLSSGLALLASLGCTGLVARAFGRLVPSKETYASRKTDLLGRVGAAELRTGSSFGIANVTDQGGARIQIRCRTLGDETIERGQPLVVADYDDRTDTFLVTRIPS